jgi:hypothetical protein
MNRIEQIVLKQVGPFEDARICLPIGANPDLADVYLLTGPNGSGKSTVLYALAGLIGCGDLGNDLGLRRLRSEHSVAAFAADGCHRAVAWRMAGTNYRRQIPDPFEDGQLRESTSCGTLFGLYQLPGDHPIHQYSNKASSFRIDLPAAARPKFSWAAFAYAGMRSVSDVHVTTIHECSA